MTGALGRHLRMRGSNKTLGCEARGLKGEGDRHYGTWVEADDLT